MSQEALKADADDDEDEDDYEDDYNEEGDEDDEENKQIHPSKEIETAPVVISQQPPQLPPEINPENLQKEEMPSSEPELETFEPNETANKLDEVPEEDD